MSNVKWLTVRDVAETLNVHEETVRRWIRRGDLVAIDLGGPRAGYRVQPSDLDAFIASNYTHQNPRRTSSVKPPERPRPEQSAGSAR